VIVVKDKGGVPIKWYLGGVLIAEQLRLFS
jgi:hypothetical protein